MTLREKKEAEDLVVRIPIMEETEQNSKETEASTPSSGKPPKIPNQLIPRNPSLSRSVFSKPKSRFFEPHNLTDPKHVVEANSVSSTRNSPSRTSTDQNSETFAAVTPKTPLIGTPGNEEDDDEEVYKTAERSLSKNPGKKWKFMMLVEFVLFFVILACLTASLTVTKLRNESIWSLGLWKWCLLILVIFCGRLVSQWSMDLSVCLIERNFLLKKKVLYFVYGVKKSVQIFMWLSLVLLAWGLLFNHGVERSKKTANILNHITRAIAGFLIGSALWLIKTLLIKILASSFHVSRFFDRIQESIFHQYVLRTLSGPPLMERLETIGKSDSGRLSLRRLKRNSEEELVVDVEKLKKMKQGKVSAWTMKGLINVIRGSGLHTMDGVAEDYLDKKDEEIKSEWEAKAAAYRIFKNVAKPGYKYIEEEDLLRFMKEEEVDSVFLLFEGASETRKIKRSSLKNWLVSIYVERKSLAHSLNDTKTAIEELNKLASVGVLAIIIVVWLLMMGFLTTQILVFISSQLLLLIFVFGNTAKNVFEAIIFVFVMHPYDVGDRCVIDGVHMTVEEMNILTTVFLRYDNEKIFYPNSVLATKPISNFYRSPEMSESIEFSVDLSTSVEQIGDMKDRIKSYLESKPQHWRPGFSVTVKEIEKVSKMKLGLAVNHTINFQNYGDKSSRRSDLVMELKKIFEETGIKYHLLPQEVHVSYVGPAGPAR